MLKERPWVGWLVSGILTITISAFGAYNVVQNERGTYIERINTQQAEFLNMRQEAKRDHDAVVQLGEKVDRLQKDMNEARQDIKELLRRAK